MSGRHQRRVGMRGTPGGEAFSIVLGASVGASAVGRVEVNREVALRYGVLLHSIESLLMLLCGQEALQIVCGMESLLGVACGPSTLQEFLVYHDGLTR